MSHYSETWLDSCGEGRVFRWLAYEQRVHSGPNVSGLRRILVGTSCLSPPMRERVASTLVRPAHDLHGVFNMAPSSGQLHLAVRFKLDGILGSLRYGAGT